MLAYVCRHTYIFMEVIVFSSRVRNYPAQNMLSAWWKNNAQNIAKPCFSFVGFVSCLKCKASSLAEPIKVNVCQTRAQDSVGGLVQVCTIKMTGLLHDLQGTNRWCSHQCQEIHLPVVERVAVGGRPTSVRRRPPDCLPRDESSPCVSEMIDKFRNCLKRWWEA